MTSSLWPLISIGLIQILAVMSPGPSFLIVARTSVARSRLEGVKIACGLGAGTAVWCAATLLGVNVLFHALPPLFLAMKLFGALFLLWIAYKIFRHAASPLELAMGESTNDNPFAKGFLVQIGNPKVVAFFGSIFVAMLPAQVPVWMAASLVAIMSFNEVWWYVLVALFFGAGPVRQFYLKAKVWIDRVTGAFLGVLGLKLLWGAIES